MKTTQTTQEERDQLRKIFDQWAEEAPSDANLDREGFVISCLPALLDDANEAERLEAALRKAIEDIREASNKGLLASGPEIADRLEGLIERESE